VVEPVRFGSKADIPAKKSDVRFTPESEHSLVQGSAFASMR
jgi:hypothetical protein